MKWFEGTIRDAIHFSKQNNCFFVVYVEGDDKLSETMTSVINSQEISTILESEKFVCVKVQYDSEEYHYFVQIYKHVPIPSLFLIGLNGVPVAVVHALPDEDVKKMRQEIFETLSQEKYLLNREAYNISQTVLNEVSNSNLKTEDETLITVHEGNNESLPLSPADAGSVNGDVSLSGSSKNVVTGDLLSEDTEDKPRQSEFIETSMPKECKQKRNREDMEGEENEVKRLVETNSVEIKRKKILKEDKQREKIDKERFENISERQRILKEIALDKEERLAREQDIGRLHQNPLNEQSAGSKSNSGPLRLQSEGQTSIQFRKPDGLTVAEVFSVNAVIDDLRNYVINNNSLGFRQFELATAFPRHVFTVEENNKTLEELELVPNAVVLILPITNNPSVSTTITTQTFNIFWYFVSPLITFFRCVRDNMSRRVPDSQRVLFGSVLLNPVLIQSPHNSALTNDLRNTASANSLQQNVHTMADTRNDDNDENNVWNGNSTQQSR